MKKLLVLLLFIPVCLSAQRYKEQIHFYSAGDIEMALGRYRIGTMVRIDCQIRGGWAEDGGTYIISGDWSYMPKVIFRGESSISDRLKFYAYVDPTHKGYAFLYATWDNVSPGESYANDVHLTIQSEGDFDVNNKGSFANSAPLENVLVVQATTGRVGIGTNSPSERLDVDGNIKWGTNKNTSWGTGLLSMNSGWNSGNYPTLGSIGGGGSLIMLHNPHVPFRTDNKASGYSGRAGLRMSINSNVTAYWDMGLAGDFFHIYRSGGKGEFLRISNQGNVGIGTSTPDYKLDVLGTIRAEEVKVETGWSDFVFEPDYDLKPLDKVANYITENGHLPDIPSAKEVEANGISLGEMDAKLLQKIEELTLYVIEQNEKLEVQSSKLEAIQKENEELKAMDKEFEELKEMVKGLMEKKIKD